MKISDDNEQRGGKGKIKTYIYIYIAHIFIFERGEKILSTKYNTYVILNPNKGNL